MKHIYVTTDPNEAITIIEGEFSQVNKHKYYPVSIKDGERLASRIGFNPMSSIRFNGTTKSAELENIALKLMNEGLLVASESNGEIKHYIPGKNWELKDQIERRLGIKENRELIGWPELRYR